MTTMIKKLGRRAAALLAVALGMQGAHAAGLMTPSSANLPQLEIRQHFVDVTIEDGYAITTVEQQFFNPHAQALEAVYSFPVPEKAAVGEFTYWIDGKPVTGEVLEKKRAREVYEQEKAQGRETALTEKDEYLTFESSVYPVQPQSDVRVRLVYIQPVHTDLGIGRYVYPLEEGGVDEQKLAFWTYDEVVTEAFRFNLRMRSSYPIDGLRLPQHPQATVTQVSAQEWEVVLASGNSGVDDGALHTSSPVAAHELTQDIVVYWRHQAGLPGSIDMVAYRPEGRDRGTFMLTVTPGDDLAPVTSGRDWVFVLDVSGSMQGKYYSLVEGVRKGLAKLPSGDRFRVVLFNNQSWELTNGYTAVNEVNVSQLIQLLESTGPGGGTNLYAGLRRGLNGLDADRPSAIILVTDGVANVGTTEKEAFLQLLEQHDVRLFSFVMGNSANRPLLEGMTEVSNGLAMSISNSDDIVGRLMQTTGKLNYEAYRDIKVDIRGVKVKEMTPARSGSLYRGQQLILFGHYWGEGEAEVEISGKVSGQDRSYIGRLEFPERSTRNPELERLWAFATVEDLQSRIDYFGEDRDSEDAIVDIALEYGLVTNYTSMVVVREEVFEQLGIGRDNAARVALEKAARQQRGAGPVHDNRQDSRNPAFGTPRAYPRSGDGGGAFGPWALLVLLPLFFEYVRRAVR